MINLLPPAELESIMYARRNTTLVKWLLACGVALVGMVTIIGAGRIIIDRSASSVEVQVAAGEELLKKQKLEETQNRVEDISASLKLATEVLSRRVILSELIPQIGATLPTGTALAGLQLNKIEGGIDLNVAVSDYQAATQVLVNLKDPENKLFDKADLNGVTCGDSDDPRYQCEANIRALFSSDNPYSLLNKGAKQ